MLKTRLVLWMAATVPALAGCAPETIEGFAATQSVTGSPAYAAHGYTRPGERNPAFGDAYAQAFARQVCPGAATVRSVSTLPSHNAFAEFLRWDAIVECADADAIAAAASGEPAPTTPAAPPAPTPQAAPAAPATEAEPTPPPQPAQPAAEPRPPGQPLQLVPRTSGS